MRTTVDWKTMPFSKRALILLAIAGGLQAQYIQQGDKLFGTGSFGNTLAAGAAVAISFDGNVAIEGLPGDVSGVGGAWIFAPSNGAWSPQGPKLSASLAVGLTMQRGALGVSAGGTLAIV